MAFNSLTFLLFFFITLLLHWCLKKDVHRKLLLLIASYTFYGWWDYRFLALLFISSTLDYFCGLALHSDSHRSPRARKSILFISLLANFSLLGFFKYFNFFAGSFNAILNALGLSYAAPAFHIILPLGISFYTFQTVSYIIDVYRGAFPAQRDFLSYSLYVAYFPHLVAGPIQRAEYLLSQFLRDRHFDIEFAKKGMRYMLWGFFLKCAIADSLAPVVERLYSNMSVHSGGEILFGTYCFAFQLYCDFAGYCYIAVGCSAFFGVQLMQNFRSPFLSQSMGEFWTRWNISLYQWLRDYVYVFALNAKNNLRRSFVVKILITFLVSGLWHGANWTFVVWGFVNGLFFFIKKPFRGEGALSRFLNILITFHIFCFGLVFFRARDLFQSREAFGRIFFNFHGAGPAVLSFEDYARAMFLIGFVMLVEYLQRNRAEIVSMEFLPRPARFAIYYLLLVLIFLFGNFNRVPFLYFQF